MEKLVQWAKSHPVVSVIIGFLLFIELQAFSNGFWKGFVDGFLGK